MNLIGYRACVYCDKCGELISEGVEFKNKKSIADRWEEIVLTAALVLRACSCSPDDKPPFLNRIFKIKCIYNDKGKTVYKYKNPKEFFPYKKFNVEEILNMTKR